MPLFGRYPEPPGSHLSAGKSGRMLGPLEISRLIDGHHQCPWGQPLSRPHCVSSGNGDILSFEDANYAMQTGVAGIMVAR